MKRLNIFLFSVLTMFFLLRCSSPTNLETNEVKIEVNANDLIESLKQHDLDPFKDNIVESQFFEITGLKDEVIEGKNGTVLIIPKGAFRNSKGELVEENIKIELAEAYSIQDMIQSNLTTEMKEELLANGGIFYINATANGENLHIDQNNPVYVEMPTNGQSKANVFRFEGVRDPKGQMHWIDKGPLEPFLVTVDINSLDFYPKGFEQAVEMGMPFRGHSLADKKLKDSLFFSLKYDMELAPMLPGGNKHYHYKDTIYTTTDSVTIAERIILDQPKCNAVSPQSIAAIQDKKFEKSLLATREFAARIKTIYKSCNQELLDLYINNLDKNLWEIDQLAAQKVGSTAPTYKDFIAFAEEKLTKVKDAAKYAPALKAFYQERLSKIDQSIQEAHQAWLTSLQKKEEVAQAKREEYVVLLQKRQEYRFAKFGLELVKPGWVMAGRKVVTLEKFTLDIKVPNAVDLDRAYVYTFDPRINSLFALLAGSDKTIFNRSYWDDPMLIVKKGAYLHIIGVGYKEDEIYFAKTSAYQKKVMQPELTLQNITKKELEQQLSKFDYSAKDFNKIKIDLQYQQAFYQEQLRLKKLDKENNFIYDLHKIVYSCCQDENLEQTGELLFNQYCNSCHNPDMYSDMTGPALAGVEMRWRQYPKDLYRYIRNSQQLVNEGQPRAVELFGEWNKSVMTPFPMLSNTDIDAILVYIRSK